MSEYQYEGDELSLFAEAIVWKKYLRTRIRPFIKGDVAEVGAGIGGTTRVFCSGREKSWLCLEPDPQLASQCQTLAESGELPLKPEVQVGTLADVSAERRFDTMLYIDVLEHIEQDAEELSLAGKHLKPNGNLIILSPAHPFLYTPFDKAIGHYRRYNKAMIRKITPPELQLKKMCYLDSVGLLVSLGNRLLLKSASPTPGQIKLWDRVFVRCSLFMDVLTLGLIGKSILAVWEPGDASAF